MTELRKRMIECLQLRGLSERTQEMYVRAVRQLFEALFYGFKKSSPIVAVDSS